MATGNFIFIETFSQNPETLAAVRVAVSSPVRFASKGPIFRIFSAPAPLVFPAPLWYNQAAVRVAYDCRLITEEGEKERMKKQYSLLLTESAG